ncbi:hypothetical protein BU24DRAFT_79699 [Aaosphaeria arxii CBS 175.79]|uniref:Zn(2)-C6 fungal-type domain-containing protein n=1 Tax=Aaosphaeria arxii CBS 175.79 TaxID=1450172 RepID=A0A6A5X9P0_9PLEO|nr:uncharacterized protein BU24DRAFT_79699 [Aaosphaeria arxii CBS 175.79]KAF2009629.1 hypothetical protein BU24DRAFT_79699 [Aaosphaeria arxii CBS 175.79]
MSTPDAEDASPSPEYSGDREGSEMAAEKLDSQQAQKASAAQKAANAKDPLRPRRKKARRACYACQRAHLTCGDERPCERCVKRGLHDQCMDGVRKKAKYLHDAPDGALMPGVGGHYPHMNGNRPTPVPGQHAHNLPQQAPYYPQAAQQPFYGDTAVQAPVSVPVQDVSNAGTFNHPQAPISPPYSQTNNQAPIPNVPNSAAQGPAGPQMAQFGGPLFDPSDPALFNFDISSLNFGNHYGALELGMLGHMSSGAAETPPNDHNIVNPLNQAAGMYNPQIAAGQYGDNMQGNLHIVADGLHTHDWQNSQSRQGSIQMHTPHNTPTTAHLDHGGHRHDSLNGTQGFAISQGPSSLSSASPASTDVNAGYDDNNPMSSAAFFANSNQQRPHRSPTVSRPQTENHRPSNALQPIHLNAVRKRRRDHNWIYETIDKPYTYVTAYHRLVAIAKGRYRASTVNRFLKALSSFRPVLTSTMKDLTASDLIFQEKNLQRTLIDLEDKSLEVGVPSLICRRSGEVVGLNKEFSILTGWDRSVLLGKEPNLNINTGATRDAAESGLSTQTNTTPTLAGQQSEGNANKPVFILELMDERSVLEWFDDFAELAFLNAQGHKCRRVKMLRYITKEDVEQAEAAKTTNMMGNRRNTKHEPLIKLESGPVHCGEGAISQLGAKDGLVDCMLAWHVKRDNFDTPMLLYMQIMPVLEETRRVEDTRR